jgi:branched-subunit amino acid aminotransferase/4-amino-4-deoxychorismate lyase
MGWIAQKQLHSKPDVGANAEPLITTSSGPQFVRETLIANFLCGMDGNLISPPRSEILNGVSLLVIEELCQSLGIAFVERELTLEEVLALGSECLITNTSFCLAPVAQIAGRSKPLDGPIFRQLLNAWSDVVGVSIREQFLTPSV